MPALFTESLSPNRNPGPAHSFGFSGLIVPQDNLTTSLKANSVNRCAAAPGQGGLGHQPLPTTEPAGCLGRRLPGAGRGCRCFWSEPRSPLSLTQAATGFGDPRGDRQGLKTALATYPLTLIIESFAPSLPHKPKAQISHPHPPVWAGQVGAQNSPTQSTLGR